MDMDNTTTDAQSLISPAQLEAYRDQGYFIARSLWRQDEIQALAQRFDKLARAGKPIPDSWAPESGSPGSPGSSGSPGSPGSSGSPKNQKSDPLKRYPRVMGPHGWDDLSRSMLIDRRIGSVLTALLDQEPIAVQSMYYFKPPGSRGQALHQDNFYLQVHPNTCIAAWTAIDPAIPDNGGLYIVPGTHRMDVQCPEVADESQSFVTEYVAAPKDKQPIAAQLQPGDVLFFNGSVIHGSKPNTHASLWRRSFICHYMPVSATEISDHYYPLMDFNGKQVQRKKYAGGGPCGTEFESSTKSHPI